MSIAVGDDEGYERFDFVDVWLSCQLGDIPKSLAGKFLVGEKMVIQGRKCNEVRSYVFVFERNVQVMITNCFGCHLAARQPQTHFSKHEIVPHGTSST